MYSNLDRHSARLPRYGSGLFRILRFDEREAGNLRDLSPADWQDLIRLSDRAQLTLLLGELARPHLPPPIARRIERNYRDNLVRCTRLQKEFAQIGSALQTRHIEFALLKGFTNAAHFIGDAALRSQGDIDLWCREEQVLEARDSLLELGYRTIGKSRGRHLDPMIRETEWQWEGDYYAPNLPIAIDLHYQLWDHNLERIAGPNETEVWSRRCPLVLPNGQTGFQLSLPDTLAFAALHSLMHLLHGDLRLQRAWEIAYFLHHHTDDDFWCKWQNLYSEELQRSQLVVFLLSHVWFGCRLPDRLGGLARELPPDLRLWLRHYAWSPVESLFKPNKHEIWLHSSLLVSRTDRSRVFIRRLLPLHAIDLGGGAPASSKTERHKQLFQRALYHLAAIPKASWGALVWWWRRQGLERPFVLFALASGLFDFGEFVFFLLYNLYLMQAGFREGELGRIAAAVTVGTFVGALPASAFMRRFGLTRGLQVAVIGTALAGILRILWLSHPVLLFSAFLNGASMAFWAVSIPPVVASLTNSQNRTRAFSIVTCVGIGVGAFAGVVGGRLPAVLEQLWPSLSKLGSQRNALLAGCALLTLSLLPISSLRLPQTPVPVSAKKIFPHNRFALTFFTALFIWSIGTGGFNPFFNVYFSRHLHLGTEQIGLIFSSSQFAQVLAILLLPSLLKRLGEVKSIAALQFATATLLGSLALVTQPLLATFLYIGYMSFQYASEPYLLSVLMTGVAGSEQKGASALYFMVSSLAGIIAAASAGALFQRVGYSHALLTCAAVTSIAALLYARFFAPDKRPEVNSLLPTTASRSSR